MASRWRRSVSGKVRERRGLRVKKSKPVPALRAMRVPGRASVHGLRPAEAGEGEAGGAGALRGALLGGAAGDDVEGKAGGVLEDSAEAPVVSEVGGEGAGGGCGGVEGGVEGEAVALVVVRAAAVFAWVEVVDGGGEKELADVVDGFGPGVGEPGAGPGGGALEEGDGEAVVVGVGLGVVGLGVGVGGVGAGAVGVDVLVDGGDEVDSAEVLIAEGERGFRGELLLDFERGLLGIGVLDVGVHEGEVEDGSGGGDGGEGFGKTGAPAWPGVKV